MMPIWAFFLRLFELLQQLVDLLQLFLDGERFGNRQRRAAGELVFGGQLIDLVLVAERFDELHELPGEFGALVVGRVPQRSPDREAALPERPA